METEPKKRNPTYFVDSKLRRKALKQIVAGDKTAAQVAREFNISRQAVSAWVKKFKNRDLYEKRVDKLTRKEKREIKRILTTKKPSEIEDLSRVNVDEWGWLELSKLIDIEFDVTATEKFCLDFLKRLKTTHPSNNVIDNKNNGKSLNFFENSFDYQAGIDEAHQKMEENGVLNPKPLINRHGQRTGKHSQGSIRKKTVKKHKKRNRR